MLELVSLNVLLAFFKHILIVRICPLHTSFDLTHQIRILCRSLQKVFRVYLFLFHFAFKCLLHILKLRPQSLHIFILHAIEINLVNILTVLRSRVFRTRWRLVILIVCPISKYPPNQIRVLLIFVKRLIFYLSFLVVDVEFDIYSARKLVVLTRKVGVLHLIVVLVYRVLDIWLIMLIGSPSSWTLSLLNIIIVSTLMINICDEIIILHESVAAHFDLSILKV